MPIDDLTEAKLVEAFSYCKSGAARRAFREILGTVLQLRLEIQWIPRGAMKYAFRIGPGCLPVHDVGRKFISVYTKSYDPFHVETVDDVIPGISGGGPLCACGKPNGQGENEVVSAARFSAVPPPKTARHPAGEPEQGAAPMAYDVIVRQTLNWERATANDLFDGFARETARTGCPAALPRRLNDVG